MLTLMIPFLVVMNFVMMQRPFERTLPEQDQLGDQDWMEQMARNVTMEETGILANCRYLLHDRDGKYCPSFREMIEAEKVKCLALPPKSPNLNAYAERWVRSIKEECLWMPGNASKMWSDTTSGAGYWREDNLSSAFRCIR